MAASAVARGSACWADPLLIDQTNEESMRYSVRISEASSIWARRVSELVLPRSVFDLSPVIAITLDWMSASHRP